ncbi:ABC transporter ATP-binding protein [Mesorhizobium sp. M7D.F.Ca.US.004.03.1.1]|uniref:ABC transporter ATP-binding protein n=1 Tax=Mesorhizobium sp. M7D.F.Ca.US.004.03.1.1 TaxID=2496702 RepID=UPI000FC9B4D8|nr:ABC transporter ATP-binding protein [Mesorhizobium sp. M7D.F.Ca.US.004.03.1.1]RVA16564.1 ABC transporter ATP-binding protein [Mesorhizobium sp. M7D.F.Ca.US.004.03.1.1]
MSADSTSVLSIQDLSIRFGGLSALSNVNIEVERGHIHSVIGPNGAGKTTFFNCLTSLVQPSKGRMYLDRVRIDSLKPYVVARHGVARTYQNIRLFQNLTCIENVLLGMSRHMRASVLGQILASPTCRREERESMEKARHLLNYVGLNGRGDMLARTLPYGEQRRLEIARAIAGAPKLLLLDEPAAGMNSAESLDLMRLIRAIRSDFAVTILLIEHHMKLVMDLSDWVSVLDHGILIAEGPPLKVQNDPVVLKAYLGSRAARVDLASGKELDPVGRTGA